MAIWKSLPEESYFLKVVIYAYLHSTPRQKKYFWFQTSENKIQQYNFTFSG